MARGREVGEGKVGQIECVVCGRFKWYPNTQHQAHHSPDQPTDYYQYKEYLAETFELGEDHELLADDTLINPNKWAEVKDDYPEIDIGLKRK